LKKVNTCLVLISIILGSCELPPQREVHNSSFVLSKFEDFPLGWTYERGLPSSIEKVPIPGRKDFKVKLIGERENPVILSQKVILKDSGNYFVFGKVRGKIEAGAFFISATGENVNKQIRFVKDVNTCIRTFFSIMIDKPEIVTLKIGFEKESIGEGYPDTLFFLKEKYFEPLSIDAREIRMEIERLSGINPPEELDDRVVKITRMINHMYLIQDEKSTEAMLFFKSADLDLLQTSYLNKYANEGFVEKNYFYELKSSVSIDEILKLYRIPVRQLYLQEDCVGRHQFLEYWNKSRGKWEIIDPYYGIRYKDKGGNFMSFEEVQNLALEGSLDESYLEKTDVLAYKSDLSELLQHWEFGGTMRIIKK